MSAGREQPIGENNWLCHHPTPPVHLHLSWWRQTQQVTQRGRRGPASSLLTCHLSSVSLHHRSFSTPLAYNQQKEPLCPPLIGCKRGCRPSFVQLVEECQMLMEHRSVGKPLWWDYWGHSKLKKRTFAWRKSSTVHVWNSKLEETWGKWSAHSRGLIKEEHYGNMTASCSHNAQHNNLNIFEVTQMARHGGAPRRGNNGEWALL